MFAQLGSIPFQGLKGFTQFSEGRSTNLAEHARIEGKPRLQRIGSNLNELSVTVLLHASFCNPEEDFAQLDDARETSEILPLVLSNGVYVSDYVVASLERTIQQTDAFSNIVSMSVNMTLKEAFNPNPQATLSATAKQNAYATSDGGSTALRVVKPLPPTTGQSAVRDVNVAKVEASTIDTQIQRAELVPNERPYISARINDALNNIASAVQRIDSSTTNPNVNPYAGSLPSSLSAVTSAVNSMQATLPIDDINDVKVLNNNLQNSVNAMVTASGVLKNAVITRII
jgi:phage protein U